MIWAYFATHTCLGKILGGTKVTSREVMHLVIFPLSTTCRPLSSACCSGRGSLQHSGVDWVGVLLKSVFWKLFKPFRPQKYQHGQWQRDTPKTWTDISLMKNTNLFMPQNPKRKPWLACQNQRTFPHTRSLPKLKTPISNGPNSWGYRAGL